MGNVTFNIQVTMNERWINDFCSMLKWMESCGNQGHSSIVGFYSDGDGDFRPKFKIDKESAKQRKSNHSTSVGYMLCVGCNSSSKACFGNGYICNSGGRSFECNYLIIA